MAFGPDEMLACYARGVFPMSESRDDPSVRLVDPEMRGVIPLDGLHISRRLARRVRSGAFEVRIDTAFTRIVAACARSAPGREETWISRGVEALYNELYLRGHAHSVECWSGDALVGGLYGVSLGGAFFGESMVSHTVDASKVALVHLAARLIRGGFALLDTQFLTAHLAAFGAVEIPRRDYRRRLEAALALEADFYRLEPYADGAAVLQAISHKS